MIPKCLAVPLDLGSGQATQYRIVGPQAYPQWMSRRVRQGTVVGDLDGVEQDAGCLVRIGPKQELE